MRVVVLGIVAWAATVVCAGAQETVSITVPAAISFPVTDVSRTTAAVPNSTRISVSNASLNPGKALRVSVQADTSAFAAPGGSAIPASNVSWTTLGASGGTGWSGALSSSSYALVFQSDPSPSSGHVDVGWTLAAPGGGIRAGTHDLTIRWKLESVTP